MFEMEFTESALEDLRFVKRFEQSFVLDAVERHLAVEPLTATLNRKPLRPNDLSQWELRAGAFRVFYDVDGESRVVRIKAIGRKEHNRLLIRGKELIL
ncbi:MAG: type II toxin-antitoxin system RelE/ParE family toxin [Acidobacteria bacterium]|nr:type II toxin-antitoxin system RelE/ParE family toxin [Acidobacteriota bacterium]